MLIRLYAWIPRSYLHVVEIYESVKKGHVDLKISNLKLNDKVTFTINDYSDYKEIEFSLDDDGLYTLTTKLTGKKVNEEVNKFYNDAKKLLLNKIIRKCHPVTYDQVIERILPLNHSVITLIKKQDYKPKEKDYETARIGRLIIHYKKDTYTHDSFTYVAGIEKEDLLKLLDYKAFIDITGHFYYDMMNKMEDYHSGTKEVIDLLENFPKSPLLTNAYLNLDLVKKDAAESWTKIEQASDSLAKKKEALNKIVMGGRSKAVTSELKIKESFNRVESDEDYVYSLWTLLLNHLEDVDTAVEARINFKRIKKLSINQWLSSIQGGFILASILIGLFVMQTGLINNVYALAAFLIIWIIIYEVSRIILMKRSF